MMASVPVGNTNPCLTLGSAPALMRLTAEELCSGVEERDGSGEGLTEAAEERFAEEAEGTGVVTMLDPATRVSSPP